MHPFENRCLGSVIDVSLLAHIINGAHLSKTYKLEGSNFKRTASYLLAYLNSLPSNVIEKIDVLKSQVIQLIYYEDELRKQSDQNKLMQFSQQLTNKILDEMTCDESICLPGGWVDATSGHAMVYLIQKTALGFQFHIYNAGAGTNYHAQSSSKESQLFSSILIYEINHPINKEYLNTFFCSLLKLQMRWYIPPNKEEADRETWLYTNVLQKLFGVDRATFLL